jgi:hypothetical protein
MNHSSREEALQRPLFRVSETLCWHFLGRGRVGRGGRHICRHCDGTGRDWTLVPALGRSADAPPAKALRGN